MPVYLLSIFRVNPDQPEAMRAFRKGRLEVAQRHGGTPVVLFEPARAEAASAAAEEVHLLEFPSHEACRAFRASALQGQRLAAIMEYESGNLISAESVLPKGRFRRTPRIEQRPAPPTLNEDIDTVVLSPQNPTQRRLSELIRLWQRTGDRRVIFAHTYYLMTTNMLEALRSGSFHDPQWVGRLLDIFASYYFNALDIHGKSPVATPSVWRFAFEVAEKPDAFVAQHLLLGVNAHINYDLTVALIESLKEDWPQMNSAVKRQRYEDHTLVNKTIEKTFDEAQHLVVARYSPALDRLHHLSRDIDDLMISSLIRSWREQAWQHAVTFLDASAWKDRHAVMQETEYIALRRADVIMLRQGPIKMKRLL